MGDMIKKIRVLIRGMNAVGFRGFVLISILLCADVHAEKVKILFQGDTQKIIDQKPNDFITTMENVLTDPVTQDADFILQMGDIVESDADNSDRPGQYLTAQTGWRKLDGQIPYVLNLGNNDHAGEFIQYFPLSHYNTWPSFVSNYNDHRNFAHHFNAGGVDWLVISVRFNNGAAEMTWAENLISSHPDKKVIFISHAANSGGSEVSMCKKYENVVLVLCGHTASSHMLLTGNHGNTMGWVKTCHHSAVKDSYFCVAELDTNTGTADFRYYSPQYGKYWDESDAPYTGSQPEDSPWQWTGFDFGGSTPSNGAQFVSQNVPTSLAPGETVPVSITFKNNGLDPWSTNNGQKLGSQNPQGNSDWAGSNRVVLPHPVATNEQVTFSFEITAPMTLGVYDFQWRMVDDIEPNQEWFGATTPNVAIDVAWPTLNKVKNPSFEEGALTPSSWGVPSSGYSRSDEDVEVGHGDYALKGTGTGSLGSVKQEITLIPHTDYNLSVRMKFVAGGAGKVVFDTWDTFDGAGQGQFVLNGPNGNWQLYEGSFNSGTNTSVTLRVFTDSSFSGTFYVDEVILKDPSVVIAPEGIVPLVVDRAQASAESSITASGFVVGTVTSNYSTSVSAGLVISQKPAAGTSVAEGVAIDLIVSAGLPPYTTWSGKFGEDIGSMTNDHDGDLQNNLYEYALNGDPTNPEDNGVDPVLQHMNGSLVYIHLLRNDDPGLIYSVETCTNLIYGGWVPDGAAPVGTNLTDGTYNEVTNSVPSDTQQSFIRLTVRKS